MMPMLKSLSDYLKNEPLVKDVLYPGKGGMLSFRLQESEWVDPFLKNLQLITFAESLGGVESFITYPATQTHADIPRGRTDYAEALMTAFYVFQLEWRMRKI